ncbi:hypothetical protein FZO89_07340 [Luteimonas viscosa]|uniref:PH domain-containing protein n=1 Tax=Luteimonas viscosa TaxID=1132694 RepID=A0A5D4XN65_9GAMM|nr:STM3941 family protein [Luteimonas viscosa]TYT26086.1 hypothetical protein FZO89_07340 [Luteimonas viscosa]
MTHGAGKLETLRPSPMKWLAMLAICAVFVWIGLRVMGTHPLVGWSCIVFFGLCGALAVLNLIPGASALVLDADGFEIVSLFRRSRVRWNDVARFGETRVGLQRLVGFDFVDGHAGSDRLRRVNRNLSGFQAALPDTYGLSANELATRMEARLAAQRADTAWRT